MTRFYTSLTKVLLGAILAGTLSISVAAQTPAPPPMSKSGGMMMMKKAPKAPVLDINTASKTELQALKGVGDKRADDIIKGRPYKGKDDLVAKKILPQGVYDGIKDKIVAKQK